MVDPGVLHDRAPLEHVDQPLDRLGEPPGALVVR
jgi:hypothetical protein